ncbi:MAG: hypothetical protein Fur002_13070 [Anaerolineales bacterium]
MNDFLNFLNTAELEALTKIPGISRPLAGELIAARPFDAAEDCLKVRGMGKNLLARMQAAFEAEESAALPKESQPEESRAMVAVTPQQQENPAQSPAAPASTFWERLGKAALNFFRALLRLVLTLAFLGAIGAALYFGLPYLRQNFIVPVEKNTAEIQSLKTQVAGLQSQVDALSARADEIEKNIAAQTERIDQLDKMQAALEKEMTAQNNSALLALQREMKFTRAAETLARARLYLSQSNFGLAETDVKSARNLLAELSADAPQNQSAALGAILARLDLALENLPALPVIAADDVDIAWELMMQGLPE